MKTVRAKFDAGVPNIKVYRRIKPKADRENQQVWPKSELGAYVIVKGESYEVDDGLENLEYFKISGSKEDEKKRPMGQGSAKVVSGTDSAA